MQFEDVPPSINISDQITHHIMEMLKTEHERLDKDIAEAVVRSSPGAVGLIHVVGVPFYHCMSASPEDIVGHVASRVPRMFR